MGNGTKTITTVITIIMMMMEVWNITILTPQYRMMMIS
jgi:hypothetical protein